MALLDGGWFGPCPDCGTSHDGWSPETFGGSWRCLAAQCDRIADRAGRWWQRPVARRARRMATTIRGNSGWWLDPGRRPTM